MTSNPQFIAAVIGLIVAITMLVKVYTDILKIKADRLQTKEERNKDSQELHDTVLKHTMQLAQMRDTITLHNTVMTDMQQAMSELNVNCAKLSVVVEQLADTVKDLKVKELKK